MPKRGQQPENTNGPVPISTKRFDSPPNPHAWGERSQLRLRQNQPDKALDDINEAIRLGNGDPTFLRWRGNSWAAKGEQDQAIADFSEAIRLDPEDASNFEGMCKGVDAKGKV